MESSGEKDVGLVPRRSLFKKSTWAKPAEEDEALQLFSRSKEIFPDVIAESERRRKKLERNKLRSSDDKTDRRLQDGKKRRVSDAYENSGSFASDDGLSMGQPQGDRSSSLTLTTPPAPKPFSTSPKSPSLGTKHHKHNPMHERHIINKSSKVACVSLSNEDETTKPARKQNDSEVIDLELDEADERHRLDPLQGAKPQAESLSEEEEEFPQFVARAREGAKRRVFERIEPAKMIASAEASSSSGAIAKSKITNHPLPTTVLPPPPDPVVQILITSMIDGTKPLILKRRLSQRLKDVRLGWCDKQIIDGQRVSENMKRLIFLTWRGNKVFDVTTCKAMGLRVDAQGRLRGDGDGFDTDGRVHLEAWTEDILEEYKKRRAAERKRLAPDALEEEETSEPELAVEKEPEQRLKIILKSKEHKEFKLSTSPKTLVSKMISAFRNENKIPANVNISLYLDGDKLDPASMVGEADVDDFTTIDVHIN